MAKLTSWLPVTSLDLVHKEWKVENAGQNAIQTYSNAKANTYIVYINIH